MEARTSRPWHAARYLGPFAFYDVADGEEEVPEGQASMVNDAEAKFIVALYGALLQAVGGGSWWGVQGLGGGEDGGGGASPR